MKTALLHQIGHGPVLPSPHRQPEAGPHGGPDRLGGKGIGALPGQKEPRRAKGVGGAPDGAHISGVLYPVQHQIPALFQLVGQGGVGQGAGKDHPLGGLGIRQSLQNIGRGLHHPAGEAGGQVKLRCLHRRLDGRPPLHGLGQQLGPLADEQPLLPPEGTGSIQLPDLLKNRILPACDPIHGGITSHNPPLPCTSLGKSQVR